VSLRLSRALGKRAAHLLTEKLCETALREGKTLAETLRADPQASALIAAEELDELFNPESCFGASAPMIERVLAQWSQSTKA